MRYAIAIEYNGSHFCGWQRQKHGGTIQEHVEIALSQVADQDITVVCAGRTDTGVHALAQIAHFDTTAERPDRAWTFGVNTHLPQTISVHWAAAVADGFHARFKAIERSYRYTLLNRKTRPGCHSDYLAWVSGLLDVDRMQEAVTPLLGTHDFSAFRSAHCQAPHARRTLNRLNVVQKGQLLSIDIAGNAFLHNMVRIIAGSLIRVGLGERPVDWLGELLEGRDRTCAGMTAPARGLCFVQALYPDEWGIPQFPSRGISHEQQC